MRLLLIGGSRFVGRHLVDAALVAGHEVTLFNRGLSDVQGRPGVRQLLGDRRRDLSPLQQGTWDAVVDTCGYLPSEVRAMARCLAGRVGRYAFISSISAYASFATANTEDSPLATLDGPEPAQADASTYGALKAGCEQVLVQDLGERALVVRPGLIVGPGDPTGRFTWWPARVSRCADGDPVLAPGNALAPLQFIDARDLAAFVLQGLAQGLSGACNAVAPPRSWRWGDLLDTCAREAGVAPRWVWVDSAWLLAQEVAPWTELPLWLQAEGEHAMFMQVDSRRAQAAGLQVRPLADTVRDTLAWWRGLPADRQAFEATGLKPEREQALLAAWATGLRPAQS